MTNEEKKAIELLEQYLNFGNKEGVLCKNLRTIYTIIDNQQKEIEELKDKNKKLKDKAKELIFEKQELTSALLDSTPNTKIKAKIEEVKDGTYDAKIVLQSLLEEE